MLEDPGEKLEEMFLRGHLADEFLLLEGDILQAFQVNFLLGYSLYQLIDVGFIFIFLHLYIS